MVQTRAHQLATRPVVKPNAYGGELRANRNKPSADDGVKESAGIAAGDAAQGEAGAGKFMVPTPTVLGSAVHEPQTGIPKQPPRRKQALSPSHVPFAGHTPPFTSTAGSDRGQQLACLLRKAASECPLSTHTCDLLIHALHQYKLRHSAQTVMYDNPAATTSHTPAASDEPSLEGTPAEESTDVTRMGAATIAAPTAVEQREVPVHRKTGPEGGLERNGAS